MRAGPLKVRGFRGRFGVTAALLLSTAALAGLSIQSVYREAEVRKRLIADTHRSIAEVVTARLDAAIAEEDRAAAAEIFRIGPQAANLLKSLSEMEASRPWLQPLVLVASPRPNTDHASLGGDRFEELFAAAEREEYQASETGAAADLYSRAASEATSAAGRAAALNGQARTELKAGNTARAVETYKKLIAATETLDSQQARLSLMARERLASSYRLLKKPREAAETALDTYEFLISHRFVVGQDTFDFYRTRVELILAPTPQLESADSDRFRMLRAREQLVNSIAAQAAPPSSGEIGGSAAVATAAIANTGAHVVHVWSTSNVRALLDRLLEAPGPWSGVSVVLVEDGETPSGSSYATLTPGRTGRTPHWRVEAFPKSGSVGAVASREVIRFASLLGLMFATVVAAMYLATRSVARELALSRTRSDFVASVSHELKTPLSLIRMFAESLCEGWVAEEKRADYYEVITRESERLTGLINNVLDFSRIESGTRQYRRTSADLGAILRSLLERYRYHLKAADIVLIDEIPSTPVNALVDSEAIEQVLVNLLSNAVKYMGGPERHPRNVRVSLTSDDASAVIRIADTGIGMSEADRVHIFERFWRGEDERVRAVAGSGLGLTLVKHIVEAHNGAIAVESALGRGSTFAVTLPLSAGGGL